MVVGRPEVWKWWLRSRGVEVVVGGGGFGGRRKGVEVVVSGDGGGGELNIALFPTTGCI